MGAGNCHFRLVFALREEQPLHFLGRYGGEKGRVMRSRESNKRESNKNVRGQGLT